MQRRRRHPMASPLPINPYSKPQRILCEAQPRRQIQRSERFTLQAWMHSRRRSCKLSMQPFRNTLRSVVRQLRKTFLELPWRHRRWLYRPEWLYRPGWQYRRGWQCRPGWQCRRACIQVGPMEPRFQQPAMSELQFTRTQMVNATAEVQARTSLFFHVSPVILVAKAVVQPVVPVAAAM